MKHKIPKRLNFFETFYGTISKFLTDKFFIHTSITPNQLTFVSGVIGAIGSFMLLSFDYNIIFSGAVLIQIYCILDAVDGDIARKKNMQSLFGHWHDVFFDKLNDFLIIFNFSLGVYLRTNNHLYLILGMVLMGVMFFLQFTMVIQSNIHKKRNNNKNRIYSSSFQNQKNITKLTFLKALVRQFVIGHSTFLFLISLFIFLNKLEFGLIFLTIYTAISCLFVSFLGFYKLRND